MTESLRIGTAVLALSLVVGCQSLAIHQRGCTVSSARSTLAWEYAPGAGGVRGRVLALGSLQPISGAMINVAPTGQRLVTDSAGRFRIRLAEGRYVLRVRALGYVSVDDTISLPGLDGFEVLAVLARQDPDLVGCSG